MSRSHNGNPAHFARTWARWEIDLLVEMRQAGTTYPQIAPLLDNRTVSATKQKANTLAILTAERSIEVRRTYKQEDEAKIMRVIEDGIEAHMTATQIAEVLTREGYPMKLDHVWRRIQTMPKELRAIYSTTIKENRRRALRRGLERRIIKHNQKRHKTCNTSTSSSFGLSSALR